VWVWLWVRVGLEEEWTKEDERHVKKKKRKVW
jgi:hypothetical protein